MSIQSEILNQLGGNKFIVMTGSKNFMSADVTETNEYPWLRMDLTRNKAGVNRLRISLMPSDTYKLEFYRQQVSKKTWDVIITKKQEFENVYADQLQQIFTQVTGLYTKL